MIEESEHPYPGKWQWYATIDEEHYTVGPAPTREAIIAEAKGDSLGEDQDQDGTWHLRFMIAECQENNVDLAKFFDVNRWLENIGQIMDDNMCGANEDGDNHPLEEIDKEQQEDLQTRVRATIRQWQKDNGLRLKSYWFAATRYDENIDLTIDEDQL